MPNETTNYGRCACRDSDCPAHSGEECRAPATCTRYTTIFPPSGLPHSTPALFCVACAADAVAHFDYTKEPVTNA